MPSYILERSYYYTTQSMLSIKILELCTTLGFSPISSYQLDDDEYLVWEFDTFNGRKAYYQCQISQSYFQWRYGNSWDLTQTLSGETRYTGMNIRPDSIIDICIARNIDLFGIFITSESFYYSSLILLPQVFDIGIWGGMDLYFGHYENQDPGQFFSGKLNRFQEGQVFTLSYCREFVFSSTNLAGNIPVLSGLFFEAPNGGGILAGLSGNTGVAATGFLERFSVIPDINNQDQWLVLYRSNGGLVIKV